MADITILLSHERSGSHLLGEIAKSFAGVRIFDEVCNAGAIKPATDQSSFHRFRRDWSIANPDLALAPSHASQTAFVRAYFDQLAAMAAGKNVIVDIKYGHVHNFEGMWWPMFRRPFLFSFAESEAVSFVHLFRESGIEAAISDRIANERRIWHSWQKGADAVAGKTYSLDPEGVAYDARLLKMQQTWISNEWLPGTNCFEITYEDLVARLNAGSNFADLATFLGGEAKAQVPELRHRKVTAPVSEVVENLEAVKAACLAAGLDEPWLA